MEQEADIIRKIRIMANVYNAYSSMKMTNTDQQKWSETNPQMWSIIAGVERMRAEIYG